MNCFRKTLTIEDVDEKVNGSVRFNQSNLLLLFNEMVVKNYKVFSSNLSGYNDYNKI